MKSVVFGLIIFMSQALFAKQIEFDEREVGILMKYEVTDSKAGPNPTYLRFPRAVSRVDNATKFFVKSASPAGSDVDYKELQFRPRFNEGMQKVEILLNDGSVIRLRIKITEDPRTPTSYDFEPKRALDDKGEGKTQGQIVDLTVMRSVLQGEEPQGMSRRNVEIPVSCNADGVRAILKRTYENEQFKVFRIELVNESKKKEYRIHDENIVLKGQPMTMSPLFHASSRSLGMAGSGKNHSWLTILSSPKVHISNATICDLGEQIELTAQLMEKGRKK